MAKYFNLIPNNFMEKKLFKVTIIHAKIKLYYQSRNLVHPLDYTLALNGNVWDLHYLGGDHLMTEKYKSSFLRITYRYSIKRLGRIQEYV